jgi:fumarate reductase subunit D
MKLDWVKQNLIQIIVIIAGIILAWGTINARIMAVETMTASNQQNINKVPIIEERQNAVLNTLNQIHSEIIDLKKINQEILIKLEKHISEEN